MPKAKIKTRNKSGGLTGCPLPDIGQMFINLDIINAIIDQKDKDNGLSVRSADESILPDILS